MLGDYIYIYIGIPGTCPSLGCAHIQILVHHYSSAQSMYMVQGVRLFSTSVQHLLEL